MVHTEDRVDPVEDLEIIHHELRLKDIERMQVSRQPASCCIPGFKLLEHHSLHMVHGWSRPPQLPPSKLCSSIFVYAA